MQSRPQAGSYLTRCLKRRIWLLTFHMSHIHHIPHVFSFDSVEIHLLPSIKVVLWRFIHLFGSQNSRKREIGKGIDEEREGERGERQIFHLLAHSMARAGPDQRPRASPTVLARRQTLGSTSTSFPRPLTRSCTGREAVRTLTSSHTGCQCCLRQIYPLTTKVTQSYLFSLFFLVLLFIYKLLKLRQNWQFSIFFNLRASAHLFL